MHEHFKKIFLNVVAAILIIAAVITGLVLMPDSATPWGQWVLGIVGAVLFIIAFVIPWLRWLTSTTTITNRRIITRTGIINKTGHDIPLAKISNVAYERSMSDRLFGCGTLVLETSADSPLVLKDIPDVEKIHVELTDLLFGTDENTDFAKIDE